jgi:hypothetical protein
LGGDAVALPLAGVSFCGGVEVCDGGGPRLDMLCYLLAYVCNIIKHVVERKFPPQSLKKMSSGTLRLFVMMIALKHAIR